VFSIDGTPSTPLHDDVDLAVVVSRLGADYTRKGFFFHRHIKTLGEAFEAVRPTLEAPPRLGVFLPFTDYPTRDYMRVFHHAARTRFPNVAASQAYRVLAREEIASYLELAVGRVSFGMFGDPMMLFLAWSEFAQRLSSRPIGVAHKRGERHVRIEYEDPIGSIPYALGVFEGIVLAYKQHPRVTATEDGARTTFDIRWDL
jgi:uncharacterized protein (TIGR02265 family)